MDNASDIIKCDMSVLDLETTPLPPFNALSYIWGADPDGTHFVLCEGKRLIVSANCYIALNYLRKKLSRFTIWVDAICINQDNELEKIMQISYMGDIYSKAVTVYAWLGEGDDASHRAMKCLKTAGFAESFNSSNRSHLLKRFAWAAVGRMVTAMIYPISYLFPLRTQRKSLAVSLHDNF